MFSKVHVSCQNIGRFILESLSNQTTRICTVMRTLRSRIRRWLRSHWICGTWEAPAPLGLCVSRRREVFQVNFSGKEESINEISEDRRTAGFPGHPQGGAYHVNWHHMKNHMDSPEGHEVEWWRSQSEIQAVGSERKENVHTRAVNSS